MPRRPRFQPGQESKETALTPFCPVTVEFIGPPRRVDSGQFNLLFRDPGSCQLIEVRLPQIEAGVRPIATAPAEIPLAPGQCRSRLLHDLFPNLITLRSDAGTDANIYVSSIGTVGRLHCTQGRPRHPMHGASPTGVAGAQRMTGRIIDYNGDAVGEDKKKGKANRVCD